ncbi:hypothetical protein AA958_15615 [Streptomyces sp. CNQ-509]|nr:hypothetical protein AA958_15615 [Streptomyces sp. CNQ-509]
MRAFPVCSLAVPAGEGRQCAASLLIPQIEPHTTPDVLDDARTLGEEDFMAGATEDRYPTSSSWRKEWTAEAVTVPVSR